MGAPALMGSPGGAGPTGIGAAAQARAPLTASAKASAYIFLVGVALVVLFGFFPGLRTLPGAKARSACRSSSRS